LGLELDELKYYSLTLAKYQTGLLFSNSFKERIKVVKPMYAKKNAFI
jgi:hypothetical protein